MEILGISPIAWGGIIFATALFLFFTGMPIWIALAGTGILFLFITSPDSLVMIPHVLFGSLDDIALLTIPLFILLAEAIAQSKASAALYDLIHKWFHWVPGAIGVSNLMAVAIISAISGSGPACAAAIGGVGIPEMRKRGYPAAFAGALIGVGATVDILIPPSIPFIVYGLVTETSIGALFIAGIIPGLILNLLMIGYVIIYYKLRIAKRVKLGIADVGPGQNVAIIPDRHDYTWKERFQALPQVLPFLLLIFAVMGSILLGWASPSESAGVGAFLAVLLVIAFFKGWKPETLKQILGHTVKESSMILLIIAAALLFGYTLSNVYATQAMADWLVALPLGKWGVFIIINLFLLVMGLFLPPVAVILLVGPTLLPVMEGLGFDMVWFGCIMMLNLQLGLAMPTVGLNMLIIKGLMPDQTMGQLFKAAIPFLLIIVLMILLLVIFPELATWLPTKFGLGTGL
jgi:C4-dicarboxylate transporter DctM subunit